MSSVRAKQENGFWAWLVRALEAIAQEHFCRAYFEGGAQTKLGRPFRAGKPHAREIARFPGVTRGWHVPALSGPNPKRATSKLALQACADAYSLGEDLVDDLAVDVGQPEIAAGVAIDQAGVVDPHEVQDRGMIIMNMHGVGHDLDAVLIGGAVGEPPFTPAPARSTENALA